jgi:hypothetical protein
MLRSRRRAAALVGVAAALAVPMSLTASAANAATIHRYCDTSVYCTIIHSTTSRKTITIKVDLGGPGTFGQTLMVENRYGDVICHRDVPYGVSMLTDYCTVPGGTFTVGISATATHPANLYVYD